MSVSMAWANSDVDDNEVWITAGSDTRHLVSVYGTLVPGIVSNRESVIAKMDKSQLADFSSYMHASTHRCGGFMVHKDEASAIRAASMPLTNSSFEKPVISHQSIVNPLLLQIDRQKIVSTISNLARFDNRFYTTSTGIAASNWLFDEWQAVVENVPYASVRQITHTQYPQKSVEVTLQGAKNPDEVVVIGGHLDSTVGSSTTEGTISPGADDDASGIAIVTESLRLMIASGIQPDKTIKFYGYAAEEVGLRGSQDIAQTLKHEQANVVSVLQLDMTNYNGSAHDITFITDYTDSNLTSYLTELIDEYANDITYDFDNCGYACSDHASWHNEGYSAAMPFESFFHDYNPYIHTKDDTLERSDRHALHAEKFAKLAIAYLVETSLADTNPGVTELKEGVPVVDIGLDYAEEKLFAFKTQEAGRVTIAMTGSNRGDADLYVKYNGEVSKTNFDCRPFLHGSNEQCVFSKPAGDFSIMLRGYRKFTGVELVAKFDKGLTAETIQLTSAK
ncbi:M20/M25/M40 family metallo-hydrolase [Vibrio sp. S4M6]|nr:M20/M25/M40 family metallo-hydrolase [Vibrio sinus]MCL9783740.1 M20/M25/M40 family metallo-hydrolase [Vibrio sinus]